MFTITTDDTRKESSEDVGGTLPGTVKPPPTLYFGLRSLIPASRAPDLGSIPAFAAGLFFSRSGHTSDLKKGAPVATLPGPWRYGVSAETG